MKTYHIYTDGSCEPNPGDGGWGFVIVKDDISFFESCGGMKETTNNRMEIIAAIEGVKEVLGFEDEELNEIIIYSDSKYVVNSINIWLDGWMKRNRIKKNMDLWRDMYSLQQIILITATWVPGHAGVKFNEVADELALRGRESLPNEN